MDNTEQTLQILSNATGTNTELLNIKVSPGVGDIVVQLDVFNEENENSKTTRPSSTSSLNLNSHHEVFQAIMEQVAANTPNKGKFLTILQHLLRIDPNEPLSDVIWKVAEKLVHRAIQLENSEDADLVINSSTAHTFSCQNCCTKTKESLNKTDLFGEDLISSLPNASPILPSASVNCIPAPPPPPPASVSNLSPPPFLDRLAPPPPPPPPIPSGLPPLPPPAPGREPALPPLNQPPQPNNLLLPQQNTPKSSIKLKTFNWTKIPQHKIINKLNIWTIMANNRQYKCVELIDFKGIEGLFCLQTTHTNNKNADVVDGVASGDKSHKKPKYIHLLDAQRSLKVNIFLSQFKGYNPEDIVQLIRNGDNKTINLEKLKDLIKFFQNDEEIMILKGFVGDRQRLASAEKFLISILEVSNFKLRIESMILKEEFAVNVTYLENCLNVIMKAGNDLMENKTLQEILGIIIVIGNFLNSGGYAGNAAGIKLSSLTKLTEIKANKTGMHLLHLIAIEVHRYNPDLLDLSEEIELLENVSKLNSDQIEKDIKDMKFALDIIKNQIYLPTTDDDIKEQMVDFIQKAEGKIGILNKQVEELTSLKITMADFFCEDVNTFKVDECFQIFYKFCEQFKQALKENERRQQLELQAKIRQKQKPEPSPSISLKAQPRQIKSPAQLRLRSAKESFNDNNSRIDVNSKNSEEDLMTFLQAWNHKRFSEKECTRKTRLDKRPDLLKFNFERERERNSSHFLETDNEHLLPNSGAVSKAEHFDDHTKPSVIQKSWKQLVQGYKSSQMRDKLLTPDIAPRRESLKIFIRSNSTIDSSSGHLKKPPSVIKIIKTALPASDSVFTFSEKEIRANQTAIENLNIHKTKEVPGEQYLNPKSIESPVELRRSRVSFKTLSSIVQVGCRYSSINEVDLKTTIKKLRTPTLEKTQFSFSPVRQFSASSSFKLNASKPDDCNLTLNEFNKKEEGKRQEETHENIDDNGKPTTETSLPHNITFCSSNKTAEEINETPEENDSLASAPSIEVKNKEAVNSSLRTNSSKNNFTKRFVSRLQNKLRAMSPLKSQSEQEPNFHSYINLKDSTKMSMGARPKVFLQQETNI